MQSFHHFLSEAIADGRLPETEIKRAFGMTTTDEFEKTKFEAAKKNGEGVDFESLEIAIAHWIQKVEVALNSGPVDAIAPNLNQKMFSGSTGVLADLILSGRTTRHCVLWSQPSFTFHFTSLPVLWREYRRDFRKEYSRRSKNGWSI